MPNEQEVNRIELVTAPVIEYSSVVAEGAKVAERIAQMNIESIEPTEENKKQLKEYRSDLTKELGDYEAARKYIKEEVMRPYLEFEEVYNKHIKSIYQTANDKLKSGIDLIETKQKDSKTQELMEYFAEINEFEFLTFEQLNLKINLSASKSSLIEEIEEKIYKVTNDLNLIRSMDNSELILARYEKSLDVNSAILSVKEELRRAEEIKNAQAESAKITKAEIKAEVIEPKDEQVYTMKFSVKGTKQQLGLLKQFLIANNIEYKGEQ